MSPNSDDAAKVIGCVIVGAMVIATVVTLLIGGL